MISRLTKTPGYRFSKDVHVYKTLPPALLGAALITLIGCQSSPSADRPADVDPQALKTFTVNMQQALQRSIALAPHYLQAHERLIDLLHLEEKHEEVVAAARRVLEYFPEHQRALEALADDAFRQDVARCPPMDRSR